MNLYGTILPSLGKLSLLLALNMSGNSFHGHFPSELANLQRLELMDLSHNELSGGIPPWFGNLTKLQHLSLNGNNFTGNISPYLFNMINLETMDFSHNFLQGSLPHEIGNFPKLKILPAIYNVSSLEVADFMFNNFSGSISRNIENLTKLREIYEIGNLQHLRTLSMGGNNLTALYLANNDLVGPIPSLGRLQQLEGLSLYGNKLQGSIPNDLCELKMLYNLSLHSNLLDGSLPACFDNLTSLRYLSLGSNKLSSNFPSTLWRLSNMLQVDLSSNFFSGPLPLDVGNLKVVISMDISRNRLSGNLPSTINGDLNGLTYLSFAENALQGHIPESFGQLTSLEFLDLSRNNISGVIPKSMEALLEGQIPTGGPFRNLSAESFEWNKALCGVPQLQVPPCEDSSHHGPKVSVLVLKYIFPVIAAILLAILVIILVRRHKWKGNKQNRETPLPLATWRRISYHQLRVATDGFSESSLIGAGNFGSVYKATLSDAITVAVKVFNLHIDGAFRSFDSKCEVMRSIRHRNLLKIISSCSNEDFKALVLEFMPNGSPEKWLYSRTSTLNILQKLDIMIDVASALEHLHHGLQTPVIHCDLKPANVLLDEDMVAHVSDFGIAKLLGEGETMKQTMTMATIGYMAPEYGTSGIVSTEGDVYSFGILLMEILTRKKLTDEMFTSEMSLKHFLKESLFHSVTKVIDATILQEGEVHYTAKINCISSVIELALDCSAELPSGRKNMVDVVAELKKIKT
ncbi:hypothetical protein V6Z12_A10G041600, partial [Gossypium hirsutum]